MPGLSSRPQRDSALLALYGQLLAELDRATDREHARQLRAHIAAVEQALKRLNTKLGKRRIRREAALRSLDQQLAAEIRKTIAPAGLRRLRTNRSIVRTRAHRSPRRN